jgi:acyl-CoA reductase-like NAD-dependent aldehyde dehydrogenase
MISGERVLELHAALSHAGRRLQRITAGERAAAIARAARTLLDDATPLGGALRGELAASTGLSAQVIERGLRTTLQLFEREALLALHHGYTGERRAQLAVLVLAGNVFSAAARPLLLPLLCGTAVLAKASSADDALPRLLKRALDQADERVGAACEVVTFSRADAALHDALFSKASLISAYGSDETIAALAARLPPSCRLIARGHGLGAIFVAGEALGSEHAMRMVAARAAIDVAAYDQRGCLPPHAIFVQRGAHSAREFARALGDALAAIEVELPRGAVPEGAAAALLQWRGVAAALGELHRGPTWAVAYEGDAPLRGSPGYRHVAVYDCDSRAALLERVAPLGKHLKALGVAGNAARRELATLAPYVCAVGAMQAPPLDAPLDGLHALAGYAG